MSKRRNQTIIDETLVALGKRLERIINQLRPVRDEHDRLGEIVEDYARVHVPDYEPGSLINPPGAVDRYFDARGAMEKRCGFTACDERLEALHRELSPLMDEIERSPATSLAGLRVKTLAAIEANGHLWHAWGRHVAPGDLDYAPRAVRSLIEAACAIAGLPIPSGASGAASEGIDEASALIHHGSAALN